MLNENQIKLVATVYSVVGAFVLITLASVAVDAANQTSSQELTVSATVLPKSTLQVKPVIKYEGELKVRDGYGYQQSTYNPQQTAEIQLQ